MSDYLTGRQTEGLNTDRDVLNAKLDSIARHFGIAWLAAAGGCNPVQHLWTKTYALATNELLNLGDAIERFEAVDVEWLRQQVKNIKEGDDGNRAGAILELLALNMFLSSGNAVIPSRKNNPGFDGEIRFLDESSLLVSIKNHGTTSYERYFQSRAKDLDDYFVEWLNRNSRSGELRIYCQNNLAPNEWLALKGDVRRILNGQLDETAKEVQLSGPWVIVLRSISPEYAPLGTRTMSSSVFILAVEHKNEQAKFVEDIRKGCSNLVKHTSSAPENALRVLFVRLGANASTKQSENWATEYFVQYPQEEVGLIILYQAAVINSKEESSLSHYILPILGPQFSAWSHRVGKSSRRLPNLSVLVGTVIREAARKVIQADEGQMSLDGMYAYQRGDIYRRYKYEENSQMNLSNPAPGIKIHAELEFHDGRAIIVEMNAPKQSQLFLLS